jgi:hypothetical protein
MNMRLYKPTNTVLARLNKLPEYQVMKKTEQQIVRTYVLEIMNPQHDDLWERAWESLNTLYPAVFALVNESYYEGLELEKEHPEGVCAVCRTITRPESRLRVVHGYADPLTLFACSYDHAMILEKRRSHLVHYLPELKQMFFHTEETAVIREIMRRTTWNKDRRNYLIKQSRYGTGHILRKTWIPDGFIQEERAHLTPLGEAVCPCGELRDHSHDLITGQVWEIAGDGNPD